MSTPTPQYRELTADDNSPILATDELRATGVNGGWWTVASQWLGGIPALAIGVPVAQWINKRPDLYGVRRLIPAPLQWIRSQDRLPTPSDLPIICKRYGYWVSEKSLPNVTMGHYTWHPYIEPAAPPAPTQAELDEQWVRAYASSKMDHRGLCEWLKDAIEYGRTHPASEKA